MLRACLAGYDGRAMVRSVKAPATYRDLLALPENVVGEIIGGELHVQPRPAMPHANAASILGMLIGPPFRLGRGGPGGWVILDEPELHLADEVLVPDLAGWRQVQGREISLQVAYQTMAPDWICEVLSPSTQAVDRVRKLPIYAAHGVGHVWLVDPLQKTLEVFRLESARWSMIGGYAGDAVVRAEPFDAIELPLAELWVTE